MRLGNIRRCAVKSCTIADVLRDRGAFDEALRILEEEVLPVLKEIGDVRTRARAWGTLAEVLRCRGELDEAIRIRIEEELPVYVELDAACLLVRCRMGLASAYLQRGRPGDRKEAADLLRLAGAAAESMRIPEAETIRAVQQGAGLESAPRSSNRPRSG